MSECHPGANRSTDKVPLPLERVRQEMDRWVDAAKTTGERALETLGLLGAARPSHPAVDLLELPDELIVLIDLPGVSAGSVELSLTGNMLSIKATRAGYPLPTDAPPRLHLTERANVRFERAIPLPIAVNADAIRAETRDGLLTVTLPKSLTAPNRSIPVTHAPSGPQ